MNPAGVSGAMLARDLETGSAAPELLDVAKTRPTETSSGDWNRRGARLALYSLRAPPLEGRQSVLDALWSDLHTVAHLDIARHVLVHGPVGAGRSSVLQAIARTASGSGSAFVLEARASDGARVLSKMLARHHGVLGLHPVDLERRLSRRLRQHGILDPMDLAAVVRLVRGFGSGTMMRPSDIRSAFRGQLDALSHHGPVVITIDDLELLPPLAREVLASVDGPVLAVWSCRDDAVHDSKDVARFLEKLAPIGRPLRPLSLEEVRRSVQEAAGLASSFARHVAEVSAGNPGLAHRIVSNLIGRGALDLAADGWTGNLEESVALTTIDRAGWDLHLDRIRHRDGEDALVAFAVAAARGIDVDLDLWHDVVSALGLDVPHDLPDTWASQGLLQSHASPTSTEFVHPVLRQRALARSPLALPLIHDATATALRGRHGDVGQTGEQLLLAHRPEEALDLLLVAFDHALEGVGSISLYRLEQLCLDCARRLDLSPASPVHQRLQVLRGRLSIHYAAFKDALQHVAPVLDAHPIAPPLGTDARVVHLMGALGVMDLPTVLDLGPLLMEHLPEGSQWRLKTRLVIGTAHAYSGDGESARNWLEPAVNPRSTSLLQGRVRVQLALAHKALSHTGHALAHIDAAVQIFEQHADRRWLGQALNERGDLFRYRGDLDRALADYSRAQALFGVMATPLALAPRINVPFTAIAKAQYSQAEQSLRMAYGTAMQLGLKGYAYAACFGLLAASAGQGEPTGFDEALVHIGELGDSAHFADTDLATAAEQSGRLWAARSDFGRARKALALAASMWKELGTTEREGSVTALLADLTMPGGALPGAGQAAPGSGPPSTPR